ncbi:MAG: hypothetical protein WD534_00195 [Phycisphaeraceae bacterium]
MWQELWRTMGTLAILMGLGLGGANLVGCEQEPDNGVQVETEDGVDVETDAPGDE